MRQILQQQRPASVSFLRQTKQEGGACMNGLARLFVILAFPVVVGLWLVGWALYCLGGKRRKKR